MRFLKPSLPKQLVGAIAGAVRRQNVAWRWQEMANLVHPKPSPLLVVRCCPAKKKPLKPRAIEKWSGAGLNRRHTDFQSVALPAELPDQVVAVCGIHNHETRLRIFMVAGDAQV